MMIIDSMNEIDSLRRHDLNLLISLHSLLEERSVTKAAKRAGVTQSAMSHQLKRLREGFGDPLFISTPGGLVPTPALEALEEPLRDTLTALERLMRPGERFDPATSDAHFVLATSDAVELMGLPTILDALSDEAPGIKVSSVPRTTDVAELLRRGDVHLAIGPGGGSVPGIDLARPELQQRKLMDEGFRVLVRDGHPRVRRRPSRKRYLELGHLLVSPTGRPGGVVDAVLARTGERRTVVHQVSHFVTAPFVIARTDLILTCPEGFAKEACRLAPLRHFAPPLELPRTQIYLYWHRRFQNDPAHRWLRDFAVRQITS